MADEDEGQVELGAELAEEQEDLRLGRDIEAGDDLVRHDELWVKRQRPGDTDALALAARQLVRVAPQKPPRQAYDVEKLRSATAAPGAIAVSQQRLERPHQRRTDGQPRVERGLRVLEDHLQPGPKRVEPILIPVGDIDPVVDEFARRRPDQPEHGAADGRLARSGFANEPQRCAPCDVEIDAFQCLHHGSGPEQRLPRPVGKGHAQAAYPVERRRHW